LAACTAVHAPSEHVLPAQPQQLREPLLPLGDLLVCRVAILTGRDGVLIAAVEGVGFPQEPGDGQVDEREEPDRRCGRCGRCGCGDNTEEVWVAVVTLWKSGKWRRCGQSEEWISMATYCLLGRAIDENANASNQKRFQAVSRDCMCNQNAESSCAWLIHRSVMHGDLWRCIAD